MIPGRAMDAYAEAFLASNVSPVFEAQADAAFIAGYRYGLEDQETVRKRGSKLPCALFGVEMPGPWFAGYRDAKKDLSELTRRTLPVDPGRSEVAGG